MCTSHAKTCSLTVLKGNCDEYTQTISCVGLVLLKLASPPLAFSTPEHGEQHSMPAGMGEHLHNAHAGGKSPERMKNMIARQQAELRGKLNLTPDQETAWQTFASAIMPPRTWQRPDLQSWQNLTAVQRMERRLALIKHQEAIMEKQLAATRTFYTTLSPEQQKIFNETFMARPHGKK